MTFVHIGSGIILILFSIATTHAISSVLKPYTTYTYSTELQANTADLWWTVDEDRQEITFELHIKTTGWIALGISPAGGMKGADVALGWVDQSGKAHVQDRYASGFSRPMIDNTTNDWFVIQGREQNGWTAIQFKRALDTCDYMDVPIKSGTNILIFAYGLEDPDMSQTDGMIYYHDNRRGSRIIPLRSYGNPPPDAKFAGLDYFDFKLNNYVVPANSTTYHCKIYKAPSQFRERRHAIAHKTLVDPRNYDLVHHLLMYECFPTAVFDDNNLPDGLCDDLAELLLPCSPNIATGWAVGGDEMVEFPEIAGYPVGADFEIKYYMVQMHYDNPTMAANRRDSTGIRFYLSNELRQHDIGYFTLGTASMYAAITIPPGADRFVIDSYCPAEVTQHFPKNGINIIAALPHTHLQGVSLWTKIIRNGTAVDYLFNAESYDFNYQFANMLPKPVTLLPGDEFATQCVYNTMNKKEITLGGERTQDEMCLHMFVYYPRMSSISTCLTFNSQAAWQKMLNVTEMDYPAVIKWLKDLKWTPETIAKWQEFHLNTELTVLTSLEHKFRALNIPKIPHYKDLKPPQCENSLSKFGSR